MEKILYSGSESIRYITDINLFTDTKDFMHWICRLDFNWYKNCKISNRPCRTEIVRTLIKIYKKKELFLSISFFRRTLLFYADEGNRN